MLPLFVPRPPPSKCIRGLKKLILYISHKRHKEQHTNKDLLVSDSLWLAIRSAVLLCSNSFGLTSILHMDLLNI